MKYTLEERQEIGRRIYEHELTCQQAADEYGIHKHTAKRYLWLYRNYVLLQSEINTKIMDVAPKAYMAGIWDAIREEKPGISGIIDEKDLRHNLEEACIPEGFSDMTFEDYDRFLDARRIMAPFFTPCVRIVHM